MNASRFHRRSIRMRGYDYARAGAYFVTICTHDRQCLFGEVVNREMRLNHLGQIVADEWARTPTIRPNVELGKWVVMPNHFHGIVVLIENCAVVSDRRGECGGVLRYAPTTTTTTKQPPNFRSPSQTIGAIIRGFESAATKQINIFRNKPGIPVWQRNYWDHIIRDEGEFHRISQYIVNNPSRWEDDTLRAMGLTDGNVVHEGHPRYGQEEWMI